MTASSTSGGSADPTDRGVRVRSPAGPAINHTHQRILESAAQLFAVRGFHGTGIRDLAASANLSTASLYHYMGRKERLLFQIMQDALQRLVLGASIIEDQSDDPRLVLAGLVRMHVVTHALQRDASNVVDNQVGALDPADRTVIIARRDEYDKYWADAIAQGVEAGFFLVPDQGAARIALLEMCSGAARWYSAEGKHSPDQIADIHVDLAASLLRGCGDRPEWAAWAEKERHLDIHALVEDIWAIQVPGGRNSHTAK